VKVPGAGERAIRCNPYRVFCKVVGPFPQGALPPGATLGCVIEPLRGILRGCVVRFPTMCSAGSRGSRLAGDEEFPGALPELNLRRNER
jgi:hypothetical protein